MCVTHHFANDLHINISASSNTPQIIGLTVNIDLVAGRAFSSVCVL